MQLPFHEVHAGDHFGHRVLHLQARVHLHEVEFVCLGVEYKLHCACVVVSDCLGSCDSCLAQLFANGWRNVAGSFFDDFLVSALNRAVALVQVDVVTVLVTEHLNFDVSRLFDILF